MLEIEDKTTEHVGKFVREALKSVFSVIPKDDFDGIVKILLLDECPDKGFNWAGGFYRLADDGYHASIELYPPKIIAAIPSFLPKIKYFKRFSIIKMFLHELGHHKFGIKNLKEREINTEKYTLLNLKKIYGRRVYFFDFMDTIDTIFTK